MNEARPLEGGLGENHARKIAFFKNAIHKRQPRRTARDKRAFFKIAPRKFAEDAGHFGQRFAKEAAACNLLPRFRQALRLLQAGFPQDFGQIRLRHGSVLLSAFYAL